MKGLANTFMLGALMPLVAAHADSDGFMCIGLKYLALESRSFDGDGKHRLYVHWLHDGIGARTEVVLPDFQTHGLECSNDVVRIRGWEETHEVDVSRANQPRYLGSVPSRRADTMDPSTTARRVSAWPTERLTLVQAPGETSYELRISNAVEAFPGAVETTTVAKLLRLSSDGALVESRVIYAGTNIETID
jgi:hypothetical protein